MKKRLFILFIFILCITPTLRIKALEVNQSGYINQKGVLFYSSPNYQGNKLLNTLDTGDKITLLSTDVTPSNDTNRCKSGFYHVSFYWESYNKKTYNGYVCADYAQLDIDTNKYAEEFRKAGFPESYFEKLTLLKDQHPNWKFTAYKTGLSWNDVVTAESVVGISYIQVADLSKGTKYISLDSGSYDPATKTYVMKESGNWYAANANTVAYYLDPRNFLDEVQVFMFENLGYNSTYQTLDVVQNIFKDTDLYQYSPYYIEAASYNGNSISPVSLAARSRQELVTNNGKLSNSANGTIFKDKQVYNFFNIGAYSKCDIDGVTVENPIQCGLKYAYNSKWFDARTAILEGSIFQAEKFINQKQNTLYFQKYNVTSNTYGNYSHQYMTNIQAPSSEGRSTYNAYSKINGLLDSSIEFLIPIYENMPEKTALPVDVDNTKKEELDNEAKREEETASIVDIVNKAGYQYSNDYISGVPIGTTAQAFISNIKGTSSSATVTVTTTDSNGSSKEISDSTRLGTGDIVTIKSGNDSRNFRIVIYGDVNGDGEVTPADYVRIRNYIMSSGSLNGSYKLAADVNKDGNITPADYVNVRNYIMGQQSLLK